MTTVDRTPLLGVVARRAPWAPVGATAALCAAMVWVRAAQVDAGVELAVPLRVTAVLVAAAAAGCLEDGAEDLTQTAPFGRARRRAVALAAAACVVAVAWVAIVGVAAVVVPSTQGAAAIPVGALTIELLGACAVGWLLAAWFASSLGWRGSGMRAGVGVVVVAIVSIAHPDVVTWLWAMPGAGPAWRDAHEHWAIVGVTALIGTALLSRDPAARLARGNRGSGWTAGRPAG